ncbi:MAG: hypothetical protein KAY65_00635 [Planctomycetes bacterium]|nr:hypothetical protein [Planctomycetota bacterium]
MTFNGPIKNVRDENAKKPLPDGKTLELTRKPNEAVGIPFAGLPPR